MEWQLWFLLFTLHSCSAHDPLHEAAINGNLNLVKRLLEGGADINQQNEGWLYTPLHYAAYYGRAEVVRYLLSLGASKTIRNHEGDTALDASSYPECDLNYDGNPNCKKAPVKYAETVRLLTAECISSVMCRSYLSCVNQKCVNLCLGFCGVNADCRVESHQPICTCKSGYSGVPRTGCQPECSRQCFNGKCAGPSICQCNQGWTGNSCQTPVCSLQCLNGECAGPNICQCNQGWTGNSCQTPVCSLQCLNGECAGPDICQCNQGWTGNSCQTRNRSSCTYDSDCESDKFCEDGNCKRVCSENTCKENEICKVRSVRGLNIHDCHPTQGNRSSCTYDSDCESDKFCEDGNCKRVCSENTCKENEICKVRIVRGNNLHDCHPAQENQPFCSIPTETDINVTILKCGTEKKFDIDEYRTIQHNNQGSSCVINNRVPLGTKVMVSCWRSPPIIVQCNQYSSWDVCSANSCQKPLTTLIHLCKHEAMNAQYCGYRPPYTSSDVSQLYKRNKVKRYPWLVGIFVKEKYVCTGTLISVRYVLTAAHCTSRSQSSSEPIDMLDVKVQHIDGDQIVRRRIDKIIHHPSFENAARPVNDISLIRLEIVITFSAGVMPSCIAKQHPAQMESAVAFDRSSEDTNYHWQVQIQKIDNRCKTGGSGDSCQQLKIKDKEFCSNQLIPGFSSAIRKGASGGPFLVNTGTEEQEQQSVLGLTSYRVQIGCAEDPYTVYTDVTAFKFWISMCLDAPLNATKDCNGYTGF